MSLYDSNTFLEGLGISPVTGQVVKRCAPTSLKDSFAIVSANLQKHYDSKPKLVLVKATKNAKSFLNIEEPLIIYNKDGSYTDEILKIFESETK